MTRDVINDIHRQTNLTTESDEYLARREELRLAEIALTQHRERVAAMRRSLPPGPVLENYQFLEGPADLAADEPVRSVKLADLFTAPDRSLVIYHLMFGKKQVRPCPMCTMWIDAANGVAHHLAQNIDFAIVAAADLKPLRDLGRARGWSKLRLLSAGNSSFKFDLGSEDSEGGQDSTISVLSKDADGAVRHVYSAHPRMSPDLAERGIDLFVPVWHYLDLTPQGRGDWYASLAYGTEVKRS